MQEAERRGEGLAPRQTAYFEDEAYHIGGEMATEWVMVTVRMTREEAERVLALARAKSAWRTATASLRGRASRTRSASWRQSQD